MAGSRRPSIYITDVAGSTARKIIVINGDESNARATGGLAATTANLTGKEFASQGQDYLRIVPRRILLEGKTSAGVTVRRSIIAYDPASDLYQDGGVLSMLVATGGDTSEAVSFSVSGVVGEKRTLVKALLDTGLDDGTAA